MTIFNKKHTFLLLWGCLITVLTHAQSITALQQQLKESKKPRDKFIALARINGYYTQTGKLDSVGSTTNKILAIARQSRNDTMLVESYVYIGNYLNTKADFESSLEFYFKALHLAESMHLKMVMLLYNNIGGEYEDLKNYGEAMKYMMRAKAMLEKEKDQGALLTYLYWHLGYEYNYLKKPDLALRYMQMAYKNNLKTKDNYIQGHIFWTFGQIYEQLNNKPLAENNYKRAISYSDSVKMFTPLTLSLNSYANYLYQNNDLKQAKKCALTGLKNAGDGKFSLEIINSAAVLSKVYTRLNMPDSANYYYQLKDTEQDSIFNQQRISRVQDITYTEQIRQTEEQARQAELEEQRKNNIQYAGIAIAIITFVVVFLLLSRTAAANPRLIEFLGVIGLLILFEFVNLLLHPFIGRYTHESPLLMLVIMVGIAALLVPLHHRLEETIKHKFVKRTSTGKH